MLNPKNILKELNFERLAGSKGEKKAIKIIGSYLKNLGLKYKLEEFEIFSFETGSAEIITDKDKFIAHPFGLTKSCNITGEMLFLENADIILSNKNAFKNKIILSYSYSRKISEELKTGKIKAFIYIGNPLKQAPSLSYRQEHFKKGYTPSVTISYEEGAKLAKYSEKKITIKIKQKVEKRIANNIITTIKGKGLDENLTLAVGHYDTVSRSPGASDNGGGSVTLLKVAEYFSKNKPERDLKIIWFSGEELGLLGSFNYVKKHEKEVIDKISLVVNIDVAGDDLGRNQFSILGTKKLLGYVDGITREIGYQFKTSLDLYSSDCMPFSVYEIPSINIARFGGKTSFYIHTPQDDIKHISEEGLKVTVEATVNVLDRILNSKIYPVSKEIDYDLREKIEKYIWNSTLKEPKLHWKPKYKK